MRHMLTVIHRGEGRLLFLDTMALAIAHKGKWYPGLAPEDSET